ncbi:MAG: hypothetical protein ABIB11_03935 [Candidatus Omnitrophota bacterium]
MKRLYKFISVLLSITIIITSLPAQSFALRPQASQAQKIIDSVKFQQIDNQKSVIRKERQFIKLESIVNSITHFLFFSCCFSSYILFVKRVNFSFYLLTAFIVLVKMPFNLVLFIRTASSKDRLVYSNKFWRSTIPFLALLLFSSPSFFCGGRLLFDISFFYVFYMIERVAIINYYDLNHTLKDFFRFKINKRPDEDIFSSLKLHNEDKGLFESPFKVPSIKSYNLSLKQHVKESKGFLCSEYRGNNKALLTKIRLFLMNSFDNILERSDAFYYKAITYKAPEESFDLDDLIKVVESGILIYIPLYLVSQLFGIYLVASIVLFFPGKFEMFFFFIMGFICKLPINFLFKALDFPKEICLFGTVLFWAVTLSMFLLWYSYFVSTSLTLQIVYFLTVFLSDLYYMKYGITFKPIADGSVVSDVKHTVSILSCAMADVPMLIKDKLMKKPVKAHNLETLLPQPEKVGELKFESQSFFSMSA